MSLFKVYQCIHCDFMCACIGLVSVCAQVCVWYSCFPKHSPTPTPPKIIIRLTHSLPFNDQKIDCFQHFGDKAAN